MNPKSPVIPGSGRPEIKVAEHQDEYNTLPCIPIENGNIMLSRWELSDDEVKQINENRYMFLYMYNFQQPITPVILSTKLVNIPKASERKGRKLRIPISDLIKRVTEDHVRSLVAEIFNVYDRQVVITWLNFIMLIQLNVAEKQYKWRIDFSNTYQSIAEINFETVKEQLKGEENAQ